MKSFQNYIWFFRLFGVVVVFLPKCFFFVPAVCGCVFSVSISFQANSKLITLRSKLKMGKTLNNLYAKFTRITRRHSSTKQISERNEPFAEPQNSLTCTIDSIKRRHINLFNGIDGGFLFRMYGCENWAHLVLFPWKKKTH